MELDLSLQLQKWMIKHQKTLVCAESCTGGFLSHLITSNPGASRYFLGSFITYQNELKERVLSISKEELLEYGAVSERVVLAMLKGIFEKTSADFGIAISGVAGPDWGPQERPVGTVWIAYGSRQAFNAKCFIFKGSRKEIIQESSFQAIYLLLSLIQ